jgi:hypothetical protein
MGSSWRIDASPRQCTASDLANSSGAEERIKQSKRTQKDDAAPTR